MLDDFSHGGQIEQFAKELSCSTDEIIDLSSNINFIKPTIDVDFNNIDISSYPTYDNLYLKIANKYQVQKDNIELFNGGSSAIFALFAHLNLSHCTIYSPAYLEYKRASKIYGYELDTINRFTQITRAVKPNSLVVFVNPSTPDGKYYDIEEFLEAWDRLNCTILIDESFLDFTNFKSATRFINRYKKLYILKSMTKFYSCASVRCGTLISSISNIKNIKQNEPMWKLSLFDSLYLQSALDDKIFAKTAKAINIKNHILLKQLLEKYNFIEEIYPSDANFFLVKLQNTTSLQIINHLKKYKIMVRDCYNFDYLDDSFIRVAVKNETSIKELEKGLDSFGI